MGLLNVLGLVAPFSPAAAAPFTGTLAEQWQLAPGTQLVNRCDTLYGVYAYDAILESSVKPVLDEDLETLATARKAKGQMASAVKSLAAMKKTIEARPHTPEAIAAEVKKWASSVAVNGADDARMAQHVSKLMQTLAISAKAHLAAAGTQWRIAAGALEGAESKEWARKLREHVEAEKEQIEFWVTRMQDMVAVVLDGEPAALLDVLVGAAGEALVYVASRDSLAIADGVEEEVRATEFARLKASIELAEQAIADAASELRELKGELSSIREHALRQVEHVATDYDAGARGRFRMVELVRGVKVAMLVRDRADDAVVASTRAVTAAVELSYLLAQNASDATEARHITQRMLADTRAWKSSSAQTAEDGRAQLVRWQKLLDSTLASLRDARTVAVPEMEPA